MTVILGVAFIITAIAMVFRRAIVGFFQSHTKPMSPRRVTAATVILASTLAIVGVPPTV